MQALPGRWVVDVRAALPGADPAAVAAAGRDLLARWDEPHRHYHDRVHLGEVLGALDVLCRAGRVGPRARSVAVLAAWFHDAVYAMAGAGEDERRSAALARSVLQGLGAHETLADDVATAVLDTVDHDLAGRDAGAASGTARGLLHDADLWILAAPTPRFDEYCEQVRAEYREVPARDYATGRSAVLRPFLVREHVYVTERARSAWEPVARENLARELTRLAG
ncbi:HD domain-containing protein [Phycicoccus flavus]|uniref:HD domain-containing protein n=1 Tax=Phycicoccus flavus TaxID=2502783 RepID=UPI000FEBF705|nr:metal-dependent phosphohydrolase [Phycicoccus flavus]NHA67936.1 metal-dependent phosphohydrolase [Phycicoccus flavus]